MSWYLCNECDEWRDDDWSPCSESPTGGLVCETCWTENACESCDEWLEEGEEQRDTYMHKHCYQEDRQNEAN